MIQSPQSTLDDPHLRELKSRSRVMGQNLSTLGHPGMFTGFAASSASAGDYMANVTYSDTSGTSNSYTLTTANSL
jgi:hypothetical protein